jgi:hypothetical protein
MSQTAAKEGAFFVDRRSSKDRPGLIWINSRRRERDHIKLVDGD